MLPGIHRTKAEISMRIAFINNTKIWSGVKTWSLSMAKSALEHGLEASVVGRDPAFVAKAATLGIPSQRFVVGMDYNPRAILWYYRYFIRNKVDAVVVNIGKDLRSAGVAARLLGLVLVQHVGAPGDFKNTLQTRMDGALLQPAFVCCSHFVLEGMQHKVPHTKKHPGIALFPGTEIPHEPLWPERANSLRIVTTSRLSADKRHIDLLHALWLLDQQGLDWSLNIVGDGPQREHLQAFCAQKGLQTKVRFVPFTTNVKAYLEQADVFVLPSECEPLGIALEEAMAYGLVPLARRAGGVPEIWSPELDHLLLSPQARGEHFAQALAALAALSPEAMLDIRRTAHEHARKTFDQKQQFLLFYEWLQSLQKQYAAD